MGRAAVGHQLPFDLREIVALLSPKVALLLYEVSARLSVGRAI